MDKNLVDKIVNTSFFNVDDLAELFKENGVSQIKTLADGTILCGAAEKCEMLIVFRFKPFGIMAEQSGKEVEGVILGGTEKEAAAALRHRHRREAGGRGAAGRRGAPRRGAGGLRPLPRGENGIKNDTRSNRVSFFIIAAGCAFRRCTH